MLETVNLFGQINKDHKFAIGVVEDNSDPLTLGRVRARYFGYHSDNREDLPTMDLPWSQVLQPGNSASISGIGWSPNGLERGSWVFAIFMDGEEAQFPLILGSIPNIHRPSAPGDYLGNSGSGYLSPDSPYSGNSVPGPYAPSTPINPGERASIKDDGSYLTKQNATKWPLKIYKVSPSRGDSGLACKDSNQSLRIHYATALALENLTQDVGVSSFKINSGYRSPQYNSSIGGAKNSMHIQGRAFDIQLGSIGNIKNFIRLAVKNGFTGFGLYGSFIHIDTGRGRVWRGAKAAWFVTELKKAGWFPGKKGLSDVKVAPGNEDEDKEQEPLVKNETYDGVSEPKNKQEVAKYIEQRMTKEGYSRPAIAATLAHAQNESGLNPSSLNPNDVGKPAYGLFQWRDSRYSALQNYATSRGQNISDTSTQMDFFLHELGSSEVRAGNALRGASSAEDANRAMASFERFAGYQGGSELNQRLNATKKFLGEDQIPGLSTQGFADPTGSLPYGGYKGKPSTHHAARGMNGNLYQPENAMNASGRMGSFPVAGDIGTIGEPDLGEAPQYPFNKVFSTKSGHVMEFDDTPDVERINIQHKSGSRFAFGAKGTTIQKSEGKSYRLDNNDSYHLINGGYKMSVKDDIDLRTTSDLTIHADGHTIFILKNDVAEEVSGKKDITVGEVFQVKAKKIIFEADQIDFVSHGSINLQAGSEVSIKAGGDINMHGENMSMRGETVYLDDVVRAAEGKSKELGDTSASSTDLGKPSPRSNISKEYEPKVDSDRVTTSEDAFNYYGTET